MIGPFRQLERSRTIMTAATLPSREASDWLYSPGFDRVFILGVPALALLVGAYVVQQPDHFQWVLALNLWLLGYHHVIATFTRIAFDRQSLEENRFFVFGLPLLVFAGTLGLAYGVGVWAVSTLYLYWQWFHYTRQSWGVSQVYRARAAEPPDDSPLFAKACLYLVPTWGILHRTWQAPSDFLGSEIWVPPTPGWLVTAVGAAAGASIVAWCWTRLQAWRRGRLAVVHTLYMLSHFVVFIVGYRVIDDITHGWLVISVWHNAQYLLFVWLFNSRRFRGGVDERARYLSTLSQPNHMLRYFLNGLAITTLVYGAPIFLAHDRMLLGLPVVVLLYQAVNFHHYIVDSRIWKVSKRPLQTTLGLEAR